MESKSDQANSDFFLPVYRAVAEVNAPASKELHFLKNNFDNAHMIAVY